MFCNSLLRKTQTPFFSALGPETEEQINIAKNKICFDL